jgi:hypothetical protein
MAKKMWLGGLALAAYLTLALPADGNAADKDVRTNDGITKTITVELTGQLIWNWCGTRCRVPEFALSVNGKQYDLDVGRHAKLAQELAGQTVVVTGTLAQADSRRVTVVSLKATSSVTTTVQVEIKGKLIRGARYQRGWIGNARGQWPYYVYAWSVRAGKDTFHLDLDGPMMLDWTAEGLDGQRVIVTGTLVGDRVKVASLKADRDGVQKKTLIEVKGKLCEQETVVQFNKAYPKDLDFARRSKVWVVEAEGKTYVLDFSRGMPLSLAQLRDRTVVVTGELNIDEGAFPLYRTRIVVTGLKADTSGAIRQTVNAKVRGRLCQDQNGAWKVAVGGTLYTLDFGSSKELYRRAGMNRGATVVIEGTLKDGVIQVRDMVFPAGEHVLVAEEGGSKVIEGRILEVFPAV